jgi:vacuolar-type H+-ATPase subunit I/STV1
MGNFSSNEDLVISWMESPGHRENILNEKYQEIGVAVKKGIFEGREVWIAVQHFGLPSSFCQKPDLSLKEKIEENEKQISELQKELLTLRSEIKILKRWQSEEISQKIDQYNELVSKYNSLVEETKNLIDQYNSQVNSFNQCLSEVLE